MQGHQPLFPAPEQRYQRVTMPLVLKPVVDRNPVSAARHDSTPIHEGSERREHVPRLNPPVLSACREGLVCTSVLPLVDFVRPSDIEFRIQAWSIRVILFLIALSLLGVPDAVGQDRIDFFEKKIRPVLAERCYQCHSAEAARAGTLMGKLQLDTREGVQHGGSRGPAVVPGQPDQSMLIEALKYTN